MSIALLVTDDSKLSRKSAIRALPPELDYHITEATNGREAIEIMQHQGFHLLLLDLTMPEIDGVGVLEYLSQQSPMPNVIVISADIQPAMKEKVFGLGAKRFLHKPLNPDELAMAMFELGYL